MLLQFSQFFPPPPCPPTLQHFPPLTPCPRVVHISSLSPLFPVPFLTSPHLFYAYQLCFFFPVPSIPFLPSPSPLKTLHVMSISLIPFLFQFFAEFAKLPSVVFHISLNIFRTEILNSLSFISHISICSGLLSEDF